MGLMRRVCNIVSANVGELLEWCENPELLIKQAIRDMEGALRSALTEAAKVVAHERLLARQRAHVENAAAAAHRQAAAAVAAGDDVAAREALRRQHDQERLLETLAASAAEVGVASRSLRRQIEAMHMRLQETRRQQDLLIARRRAAEARRQLLGLRSDVPLDHRGFQEFDRLTRKVEQTEAEADALTELAGLACTDQADIHDQEAAAWIEHVLKDLKNEIRTPS